MVTHNILIEGDSEVATSYSNFGVGESWANRLKTLLQTRYPSATFNLINNAVGGTNSANVANRINADIVSRPSIVLLAIGTNDAAGEHSPTNPTQTIAQTETNIRNIITSVLSIGSLLVIFQPPAAVSKTIHNNSQTSMPYWRSYDSTEATNNITLIKDLYTRLATEYNIPIVKVFDKESALGYNGTQTNQATQAQYLIDGVHISSGMADNIAQWGFETITSQLAPDGSRLIITPGTDTNIQYRSNGIWVGCAVSRNNNGVWS